MRLQRGRENWKLPVHTWSACSGNGCICFRTAITHCIVAQTFRRAPTYYATHNIHASRCHTFFVEYFGYSKTCRSHNATSPQIVMLPGAPVHVGRDKPELVFCGTGKIKEIVQVTLIVLLRVGVPTNTGKCPCCRH